MKKLLFVIALFCLPSVALTGCGRSGENKIIEDGEVEGAMTETRDVGLRATDAFGRRLITPRQLTRVLWWNLCSGAGLAVPWRRPDRCVGFLRDERRYHPPVQEVVRFMPEFLKVAITLRGDVARPSEFPTVRDVNRSLGSGCNAIRSIYISRKHSTLSGYITTERDGY